MSLVFGDAGLDFRQFPNLMPQGSVPLRGAAVPKPDAPSRYRNWPTILPDDEPIEAG